MVDHGVVGGTLLWGPTRTTPRGIPVGDGPGDMPPPLYDRADTQTPDSPKDRTGTRD